MGRITMVKLKAGKSGGEFRIGEKKRKDPAFCKAIGLSFKEYKIIQRLYAVDPFQNYSRPWKNFKLFGITI